MITHDTPDLPPAPEETSHSQGYWRAWYILVIGWLVLLMGLFDLFTKSFS